MEVAEKPVKTRCELPEPLPLRDLRHRLPDELFGLLGRGGCRDLHLHHPVPQLLDIHPAGGGKIHLVPLLAGGHGQVPLLVLGVGDERLHQEVGEDSLHLADPHLLPPVLLDPRPHLVPGPIHVDEPVFPSLSEELVRFHHQPLLLEPRVLLRERGEVRLRAHQDGPERVFQPLSQVIGPVPLEDRLSVVLADAALCHLYPLTCALRSPGRRPSRRPPSPRSPLFAIPAPGRKCRSGPPGSGGGPVR